MRTICFEQGARATCDPDESHHGSWLYAKPTNTDLPAAVSDPTVKEEPGETQIESGTVAQVNDPLQLDKSLQAGPYGEVLIMPLSLVCVICIIELNAPCGNSCCYWLYLPATLHMLHQTSLSAA